MVEQAHRHIRAHSSVRAVCMGLGVDMGVVCRCICTAKLSKNMHVGECGVQRIVNLGRVGLRSSLLRSR